MSPALPDNAALMRATVSRASRALPVWDAERRIRVWLPPHWALAPLCGTRRLEIVADDEAACIYLMSHDKARLRAHAASLEAWAATRVAQVPRLLAKLPTEPLSVALRRALRCTVLREVPPNAAAFAYCVTFVDAGDRFDEVILHSYEIERTIPVLTELLRTLEYRTDSA